MRKKLSIIASASLASLLALSIAGGCASRKMEDSSSPEGKAGSKAAEAYKAGDFQKSADSYMEAIAFVEEKEPEKAKAYKAKLASVYYEWALFLSVSNKKEKTVEAYEQAIGLCKSASDLNPLIKGKCSNLSEKCQKNISILKYHAELADTKLIPDGKPPEEKIDIFMKQGDAYYAAKNYAEARRRYEKVIKVDPYNMNAIQAIRKVDFKVAEAGRARAENARSEMMAEVKWAGVQPVPPKAAGEGEGKTVDSNQSADTAAMEKALRDVYFPFVSFDKASLKDIFVKLEADTAKAGYPVKFLLDGVDLNSPEWPLISFKTDKISLAETLNSVCKPFGLLYVPAGGNQLKIFRKPKGQGPK